MATRGSDPDLVQRRVGSIIRKKWKVDSLIGVGGMAAVYAATHRNGHRAALKVLHAALSADTDVANRFTREGYVANSVDHPGVVRVLDDDHTEDGAAFLVMELLKGETTDRRADRMGGRLPLQDVIAIIDGLLDVLAAAHACGVVHRDIKPENVFFTRERSVKVLDFGIARLRDATTLASASRSSVAAPSKWMTQAGATLGTPAFMPPEQAAGRMSEVDALSDVWATGATMFTLLSGYLVHEAESADLILVAAATKRARSLRDVAPDVAESFIAVADRALEFDKARRWSSARAMQYAVRQAKQELGQPLGSVLAPPSTSDAFLPVPLSGLGASTTDRSPPVITGMRDHGSLEGVVVQEALPRRAGRRVVVGVAALTVLGATAFGTARLRGRAAHAASVAAQAAPSSAAPVTSSALSETAAGPATGVTGATGDGEPAFELDTASSPHASGARARPSPAPSRRPKVDGTWLDRRK